MFKKIIVPVIAIAAVASYAGNKIPAKCQIKKDTKTLFESETVFPDSITTLTSITSKNNKVVVSMAETFGKKAPKSVIDKECEDAKKNGNVSNSCKGNKVSAVMSFDAEDAEAFNRTVELFRSECKGIIETGFYVEENQAPAGPVCNASMESSTWTIAEANSLITFTFVGNGVVTSTEEMTVMESPEKCQAEVVNQNNQKNTTAICDGANIYVYYREATDNVSKAAMFEKVKADCAKK